MTKSVTRLRANPINVKGDTNRKFIFICCILFFFAQNAFSKHSQQSDSNKHFILYETSSGALALDEGISQKELFAKQSYTQSPAQLTPFFFQPVPLNTCDRELLLSISGIGPFLADNILTTRKAIGNFSGINDLLLVPGIGELRMQKFAKSFSIENAAPLR